MFDPAFNPAAAVYFAWLHPLPLYTQWPNLLRLSLDSAVQLTLYDYIGDRCTLRKFWFISGDKYPQLSVSCAVLVQRQNGREIADYCIISTAGSFGEWVSEKERKKGWKKEEERKKKEWMTKLYFYEGGGVDSVFFTPAPHGPGGTNSVDTTHRHRFQTYADIYDISS